MGKHIATVYIPSGEFDRINRLLSIDSLEEMSDDELIMQGQIPTTVKVFSERFSTMEVLSILTSALAPITIGMM